MIGANAFRTLVSGPALRGLPPLAVLVALAACGGAQGAASAPPSAPAPVATARVQATPVHATGPVDACGLVSPAEVASALGVQVDAGRPIDQDMAGTGQHMDACNRTVAGGTGILAMQVLSPATQATLDGARSRLAGAADVRDASGIGDAAFSYTRAGGGPPQSGVCFLKGGYEVEIVLDGASGGAGAIAGLATLARTAASRLP